jgi:hypothetical protein
MGKGMYAEITLVVVAGSTSVREPRDSVMLGGYAFEGPLDSVDTESWTVTEVEKLNRLDSEMTELPGERVSGSCAELAVELEVGTPDGKRVPQTDEGIS